MIVIRKARPGDIDGIMECYDIARQKMRESGNFAQWINGYPSRELLLNDIREGNCFVGENGDDVLVMVFVLIMGEDPSYKVIKDGSWLNSLPYGTIHRLASNGIERGVLKKCIDFCFTKINNLRLDTHADNLIMQKGVGQLGFIRCGVIFLSDGSARVAFQKYLPAR